MTTIGSRRTRNIDDTRRYIDMIGALGHATAGEEHLDAEALRLERLALLLRTDGSVTPITPQNG